MPPRPRDFEPGGFDAEADAWAKGLHRRKRASMTTLVGNTLLFVLLVGGPFVRGYARAFETLHAYAALSACLYGGSALPEPGIATGHAEAQHFAAELLRHKPGFPASCTPQLERVAQPSALFLWPSVKDAEERVREAVALVRGELAQAARHTSGAGMPHRVLRAMTVLRESVEAQLAKATIARSFVQEPIAWEKPHGLPAPARLPVYTAPDAPITLWGDDHTLQVLALDRAGLSYLKAAPNAPLVRARMGRSKLLHGVHLSGGAPWLVWATPASRCAELPHGCYGKTLGIAEAELPLLDLPQSRSLAAHMAGRVDRGLLAHAGKLWLAALSATDRVAVLEFTLPSGFVVDKELPPLRATKQLAPEVDDALLVPSAWGGVALGTRSREERAELLELGEGEGVALAELSGAGSPWLVACSRQERVSFVFGRQDAMLAGTLRGPAQAAQDVRLWRAESLSVRDPVHAQYAGRDLVVPLCLQDGALIFVRDAERRLRALYCADDAERCRDQVLAAQVEYFAAAESHAGALVAYASQEAPQIRVRTLAGPAFEAGPERVPSACWDNGHGMCGRPNLARLGRRVVLTAYEGSDLVALESPDGGHTWSAPPVW